MDIDDPLTKGIILGYTTLYPFPFLIDIGPPKRINEIIRVNKRSIGLIRD